MSATPLPRPFTRLWAAVGVSTLGDGVHLAALPLVAASITSDPVAIGVVTAAGPLPWLLFGLLGGALVDRWERKRAMWVADIARAVLLGLAVLGAAVGLLGIPLLVGLAFLLGIGQLVFDTAAQSYLPDLLGRDHDLLYRANTRLRGAQTLAEGFAGPPLGSLLFTVGRTVPFVVDGLSFLVSSTLVRSLPPGVPRAAPTGSLLAEARAGAVYLLGDRVLLGLALRPALGNLGFLAGEAVLVLFARETLHLPAVGYGLLLAAQALGGLLGTVAAGRVRAWFGIGGALAVTAAIEAASQVVLGLSSDAVLAGCAVAACGAAMGATMVISPSVRQAIVPAEFAGRASATGRLLAFAAAPLGALVGGYLGANYGLRAPFLFGGVVLAVMTVITSSLTSNRRVDAALAAATPTTS